MNWRRRNRGSVPLDAGFTPAPDHIEPASRIEPSEAARVTESSDPVPAPEPIEPASVAVESDPAPALDHTKPVLAAQDSMEDLGPRIIPEPGQAIAEEEANSPQDAVPEPRPLPREELEPVPEGAPAPRRSGAVVMAITNQKGGVGKTTTTVSLGAALAAQDLDVLVIDLDPQGNATTGLGVRVSQGAPSTYRVIVEQMPMEDAAEPTAVRRLHVVPSSLDLAGAEIELVPQFSRERRLADAVDAVRDQYDVVLIDCPPSLGLLTVNALVASDQVLVPIQCEYYALEGLGQLMRTIDMVRDGLNGRLHVGGVLMTMFDARTNLSQQVVDEVRGHFGDLAYTTVIPRTVRLSEAPSFGQPITEFDPTSRGARSYQRLAQEVARRLGLLAGPASVSALDALLGTSAHPPDDSGQSDPPVNSDDASGSPETSEAEDEHGDVADAGRTATAEAPGTSPQGSGHSIDADDAMFHVDPSTGTIQEDQPWQT